MERKLILPAEVKVCATCSFWDGERKVDTEMQVVVVAEASAGECLVRETDCASLKDVRDANGRECAWESLAPDLPESAESNLAAADAEISAAAEPAAGDASPVRRSA
jgi:hypothetical protein